MSEVMEVYQHIPFRVAAELEAIISMNSEVSMNCMQKNTNFTLLWGNFPEFRLET